MRSTVLVLLLSVPVLAQEDAPPALLELEEFVDPSGHDALRGVYRVRENRALQIGPWLELDLVVLLSTGDDPAPDPVFFLHGGPGAAATGAWRGYVNSWMRAERDIVLLDQRGTGGNHALRCPPTEDTAQTWLDPLFLEDHFRACMQRLSERHDLTQYTTPIAAHDLDEVAGALGYEQINLIGGSYGTRMALVMMREHPARVRSAVLDGVAPISFVNPLFHAASAQEGWDTLVAECAADPACSQAFPDLDQALRTILARLEDEPAEVEVRDPASGERVTVRLSRDAFAEALRTMMYYTGGNRQVPLAVHGAFGGDYTLFAERGMQVNRSIRNLIAGGMLLSVTCPEDVARITPELIGPLTEGTFLGDVRVRAQMAICEFWPQGDVGEDYGDPVSVSVPTLVLSGTHDPVTPPRFGARAAEHLPNSLHLAVPGCHGVARSGGVAPVVRQFLARASVEGLDTSSVDSMKMPPFALPKGD